MREILFRGKRVDNGEWAYGYYAESHRSMNSKIKPHKAWIVESFASNGGWLTPMIRRAIYDETVGQYTGVKDLHGKSVFEGDIVKIHLSGKPAIGVVEFGITGIAAYIVKNIDKVSSNYVLEFDKPNLYEVVGNVFDNSLEGKT